MADVVTYTAPCPTCGGDATWTSQRRDFAGATEYHRGDGAPVIDVHDDCEGVA